MTEAHADPPSDNVQRDPPAVAVGATIGTYRLEATLGHGGMGVVFRALDTKLNRPVSVKFLSDTLADAAGRRRFQREAQMASSLNHPHILTVYDAGEVDDRQYLVTEIHRRRHARGMDRTRASLVAQRRRAPRGCRRRARRRTRSRYPPPRYQAREHPRHAEWLRQARGFRAGQASGGTGCQSVARSHREPHASGDCRRHDPVHVTRAGKWRTD